MPGVWPAWPEVSEEPEVEAAEHEALEEIEEPEVREAEHEAPEEPEESEVTETEQEALKELNVEDEAGQVTYMLDQF
jgi:hypothetical protein